MWVGKHQLADKCPLLSELAWNSPPVLGAQIVCMLFRDMHYLPQNELVVMSAGLSYMLLTCYLNMIYSAGKYNLPILLVGFTYQTVCKWIAISGTQYSTLLSSVQSNTLCFWILEQKGLTKFGSFHWDCRKLLVLAAW